MDSAPAPACSAIFALVSTLDADNLDECAHRVNELTRTHGHSAVAWYLRSLLLVDALLSSPDTRHLVAADPRVVEAVIEGTLASAQDSSLAAGLVLQAVGSLRDTTTELAHGVDFSTVNFRCIVRAAYFLRNDYWASLAVASALSAATDPQTSQLARLLLLPSLLAQLPDEKLKAGADKDAVLPVAIASLATAADPSSRPASTQPADSPDMGLAEQLLGAGPHAPTADIISRYTEQQKRRQPHSATQAAGSSAKKPANSNDLQQQGAITSDDVAKAVALIASSMDGSDGASWSANEFAAGIGKHCPGLVWEDVVYRLPYSGLDVKHEQGVAFVVDTFLRATAGQGRPFPYSFMYEVWPDAAAQVAFLRCALRSASSAAHLLDKQMPAVTAEPLDSLYRVYHPEFTRLIASPWNSFSLILVLSHLLDSKAGDEARALLDAGIAQEPLLVTLELARLKIQHPRLQALLQHNLVRFLKHELANSGLFFELFRSCDKKTMLVFFCNLHRKDAAFTRHTLGVLADLGLANDMLLVPKREDIMMLDFIVELAIVASRRGMIAFESWFPGLLAELGSEILHASLDILHAKLQLEAARQRGEDKGTAACSSTELATMFKALGTAAMSPNNAANLKALYSQFLELVDELQRTENERAVDDGQIEKEAETLFLRLYRGELSVDQMADTLDGLRDSLRAGQRRTFAHVVQYPLEEFSFFDNYPEKELAITGQLVGTLVQRHMLPPASEPAILDMLLKALQAPAGSKSFHFGMTALQACQARLEQMPVFCTAVCQIPGFRQSTGMPVVALVQSIIGAALPTRGTPQDAGPGGRQSGPGLEGSPGVGPGAVAATSRVFHSVRPPVLPAADGPFADPSEDTRDKIQFAVNNLARSNLGEKTGEVGRLLQARHFVWFSREVVVKRASQEPNYHALYLHFLDALDRPLLTRCILCETLGSIARLLNADSTVHSSRDRGYLKNLGAWLGGITLARNQPILRENVSFKELLCEGFRSQRLIVAIPFVCKVLEQAARSTVFHPPNPWLMGIMAVLTELYGTANLKLNLTFEIEVLCKALALDVKEIPPADILSRPAERTSAAAEALAADLGKIVLGGNGAAGQTAAATAAASALAVAESTSPVQLAVISGADITVDILGVLSQHATFQAADTMFAQQPTMKKMFFMLTERMIREIIPVHVSRSVYVAVSCTRDTIQKDFCGEPNEEHVHRAAQVMARGVAGALAVSLCREQLKSKLYLTMREFLIGHSLPEASANSVAVGLVADNLDLACAIAEKEAIERASQQIDTILGDAYAARQRTRERTGQPFYDMARHSQLTYPPGFPEVLKVRLSGLQAGHLRVYEDFTQIPHFFSQIGGNGAGSTGAAGGGGGAVSTEPKFSAAQCLERFAAILSDLDQIVVAAGASVELAQLPAQHEACLCARDILVLATRSPGPDETAMDFAQALIGHLYRAETRLGIELYVLLLARMCEVSARAAKEVTSWLAFADDERKFNVAATVALINEGLVSIDDEDGQLARLVDAGRPTAVSFAVRLVRKALVGGAVAADSRAFVRTLQSLARLAQAGRAPAAVTQLLADVRASQAPAPEAAVTAATPAAIPVAAPVAVPAAVPVAALTPALAEETASYQNILHNWTRVCEHPAAGDAELATLVRQLVQQTPLQEPQVEAAFFRACIDAAVAGYAPVAQSGRTTPRDGRQMADALVRLVVYLTRLGVGSSGSSLQPMRMFLSSVALAIVHGHSTAPEAFSGQQRAYFRLLCGLLSELHTAHRAEEPWCSEVFRDAIALLGETLQMLAPAFVPGFAFGWLMLASHRFFFPRLAERPESWPVAAGLLEAQLRFLEPFIEAGRFTPALKLLYRGTVCVVLVVLHDFPEFLASYALRLCDAVPAGCVQLRNLLLSAYPRSMRLPEPLTPNLKIDLLPDIARSPDIPFAYKAALEPSGLADALDAFLQTQQPADFAATVVARLRVSDKEPASDDAARYSTAVVNAFVLHAVVRITQTGDEAAREATQRAALDMFREVLSVAEPECRYLVISAIANQLRFPSSHTYLCSRVVLALFAKSGEAVRECIARVLVERILVNRPFPWGLLVTLIELLRNPFYAFWNHEFTHASPQIAEILTAVAKSIHLSDGPAQQAPPTRPQQ